MSTVINSYKLNPENAKQVGVSTRIDAKGAYVGQFTRAEAVSSQSGSVGIELAFKTNEGRTADYLTLWTHNGDGDEIYGRKVLDALMTCMGVREIALQPGRVMKYDANERKEVMVDAQLFPALMGKPIGLLLVREEYEKSNSNETGWKLVIVGAFNPTTRMVPKEILGRATKAEALDNMIELLQDRPLRKRKAQQSGGYGTSSRSTPSTGTGFDSMDDDFPF